MSIHPKPSLDSLPVELIHHILNHLDTPTTLLSLHKVCKRLNTIVETYPGYKLDFRLISKSAFYSISRLIPCQNIISLTISDGYKTRGQIQYFFQLFNLEQFTRLRTLNFLQINRQNLIDLLKYKIMLSLRSLKLQFREHYSLQYEVLVTLSTFIEKSNLRKLDFNLWYCPMKNIVWPNECYLEYLKIHRCSLDGHIKILRQTSRLRTFILDDLEFSNGQHSLYNPLLFKAFHHLQSLTLENCHRFMYQMEYILSYTPSLVHLKIVSDTNLLDGYRWEEYIRTNLILLKKFEFFFLFYSHNNLSKTDVELLIKSYQTSFWLQIKQWFVTCEYIRNSMKIRLYSIPVCKANYVYHLDSNKIVYSTLIATENSSTDLDQVSTMRLNWTQMMQNVTDEPSSFASGHLFCKLKNLSLDIDQQWPFNSLQMLSKIIDLSRLSELTLNVTFDRDFVSNAVENITTLLEQTYNVHSLSISHFLIDDDYDISIDMFCSMIPLHVKYIQIKLMQYDNQRIIDDVKILLNRLEHLWSITLQFDPFLSLKSDHIIEWLRDKRQDFTHIQHGHYLHIWLGKTIHRSSEMTINHHSN